MRHLRGCYRDGEEKTPARSCYPQPMKIWIDADAAPRAIKEIIYRASLRLKLPVDVWGENLFHSSFGIATTLMLYAFAAPGSLEAVSFARKAAMCGGLAAINCASW